MEEFKAIIEKIEYLEKCISSRDLTIKSLKSEIKELEEKLEARDQISATIKIPKEGISILEAFTNFKQQINDFYKADIIRHVGIDGYDDGYDWEETSKTVDIELNALIKVLTVKY